MNKMLQHNEKANLSNRWKTVKKTEKSIQFYIYKFTMLSITYLKKEGSTKFSKELAPIKN